MRKSHYGYWPETVDTCRQQQWHLRRARAETRQCGEVLLEYGKQQGANNQHVVQADYTLTKTLRTVATLMFSDYVGPTANFEVKGISASP
ncbi:hypothetical protein [Methyloglobulus sp.]|uniref:hypothetical protein n=1 Tax=Methyloglobulus sp. TaxID=2518622 RepID=UPI003989C309